MYWLSQLIYHYILTGTTNVKYFCHFKVDVKSLLKLKHIAACAHAYTSVSILIKNNYIRVLPVGVFIEAIGPSLFYRLIARERERERERERGGGGGDSQSESERGNISPTSYGSSCMSTVPFV